MLRPRGAEKEVLDLAAEVNSLSDVLRSLPALASRVEAGPFETTFRMHHVYFCQQTLLRVETRLKKAQEDFKRSIFRRLRRRLQWPFTVPEVKKLLGDLTRHKGDIGLALGADSITLLLTSLDRFDRLERSLEGIQSASVAVNSIQTTTSTICIDTNSKRKVLSFFITIDPGTYLQTALSTRMGGTGLWLTRLQSFLHWYRTPGSTIWLHGAPGSGKTVLSGLIVQKVLRRRSGNFGVAYFYGSLQASYSAFQVIGTLASQLAQKNEEAYEALHVYYKSLHRRHGLPNAVARVPTIHRLVGLFQEISECFEQVYIIVDGLDKCDYDVAGILPEISGPSTNVSLVVLSRKNPDIQHLFLSKFDYEWSEISMVENHVIDGIVAYI